MGLSCWELMGGGIVPFEVNGRLPVRCDVLPRELFRAIEVAERWEEARRIEEGTSIRSYRLLEKGRRKA